MIQTIYTRVGFLSEYPIPWRNPDPEGKKSRKNPESQG